MRGISLDLVLLVLFGAGLLIQWVMRRVRGRAVPKPDGQHARAAAPPPARSMPPSPSPPPPPPGASAAMPPAAAVRRRAPAPRRFSRDGLLRDRRAMQSAVVAAAILAPCHAQRR